jgi:thiosulfate/3-mercaptopyruvate sulfurtransferase
VVKPFVDIGWLVEHRDSVVVADIRFYIDERPGRPAYEAGHLPGAVYVELRDVLAEPGTDAGGRHPLPSPRRFAAGLAAAGIGDGDTVVAYDDAGGVMAARLVWLLRAIDHPASLLDGGLSAWPGELETGPFQRLAASFTERPWPPERFVTIDDVAATDDLLIDARDAGRFAGGPDPVDPRSGHIPGARSLPTREHLRPDGRLLEMEALVSRFAAVGIEQDTNVISYCGSGVTACHNLLVMEAAGLGPGRLYPGSWSQWSRDESRPVETGADQER